MPVPRARLALAAALVCGLIPCVGAAPAAAADGTVEGTVRDPEGNPLVGLMVSVDNCGSGGTGVCGYGASTDIAGRYSLRVPPGSYTFTVRHLDNSTGHVSSIDVPDGGLVQRDAVVAAPAGSGVLRLTVVDEAGLPQRGSFVSLHAAGGGPTLLVPGLDPGGGATLRGVPAGTYAVDANAPGATDLGPASGSVAVGPDSEASLELVLPALFTVPAGIVGQNAQRDLGWLNEQRARNGLPAGIVENPRWSAECEAHNRWQRLNNVLDHFEQGGTAGYSEAGNWAGTHSVLSMGSTWSAVDRNPWEDAPIHLVQLLTPSLASIGISDDGFYVCATTWPGMDRFPVDAETVRTYPGDGVTGVEPSERAAERPFVPGDLVGLPMGTTTGRHLFVFRDSRRLGGPAEVHIANASLTGPDGAVALRWVDDGDDQIAGYITGAIIIPVAPLAANTRYTATVRLDTEVGPLDHSWSFTTGADPAGSSDRLAEPLPNWSRSTKARFTGVGARRPKLRISMRGSYAAAPKRVTVRLPVGMAAARKRQRLKTGTLVWGARRMPLVASASGRGRRLTVRLRRPYPNPTIQVRRPALRISRTLTRRVRHRRVRSLPLALTITDSARRTTRIVLRVPVS